MPRREPDGDTGVEVIIDRIRDIERELEELKAFVAGKLPHDHDGRYVNESGDTVSGDLDAQDSMFRPKRTVSGTDYRAEYYVGTNGDLVILLRANGSLVGQQFRQRASQGDTEVTGDLLVDGAFDATGAKNALVDPEDPDNPNLRYRFACVEADEPGLLFHRLTVAIPAGGSETTVGLPGHWARIARDGDAMVTPLDDTRDQAPAAAAVDLTVPEVTVRGKPGDYRVWVMAARADAGVDGWTHEVEVTPDDDV